MFSAATAALAVDLNGKEIAVPAGHCLSGKAHFQILDTLIGHKCVMSFRYCLNEQKFILAPEGTLDPSLTNKRMSAPKGLSFELDCKKGKFTMQYVTTFYFLGNEITLDAGFKIGKNESPTDSLVSAHFFGSLQCPEGFSLTLGPIKTLEIYEVTVDADVSPGGSFGTVGILGTFKVGPKGRATIGCSFSENPAHDAFEATVEDATMSDIVKFNVEKFGIELPPIPLLNDILIKKLSVVYTPDGMQIGNHVYPAGFCFNADIVIGFFNNLEMQAMLTLSKELFEMKVQVSPFSLGGIIEVSGADGKNDALLHLKASKDEALIEVDCRVKFLFVTVATKINIRAPSTFDFMFNFDILGLSTKMHVLSEDDVDGKQFRISFEFGDSQRQEARQKVIDQVLGAAQQMMDDAGTMAKKGEECAAAYEEGVKQLKENLEAAVAAFDAYCDQMRDEMDEEEKAWDDALDEAEKDKDDCIDAMKNDHEHLQEVFENALADAQSGVTRITEAVALLEDTLKECTERWDEDIAEAQEEFNEQVKIAQDAFDEVQKAYKSAQKNYENIRSHEPTGRNCSSSEKATWRRLMDAAGSKLGQAHGKLWNAGIYLASQKAKMNAGMEKLREEFHKEAGPIQDDLNKQQATLADLKFQLAEIEDHPIDFKKLARLYNKKRMIEKCAEAKIKRLSQRASISEDAVGLRKHTMDHTHAADRLQAVKDAIAKQDEASGDENAIQAIQNCRAHILANNGELLKKGDDNCLSKWENVATGCTKAVNECADAIKFVLDVLEHKIGVTPKLEKDMHDLYRDLSTCDEGDAINKLLKQAFALTEELSAHDETFSESIKLLKNLTDSVAPFLDGKYDNDKPFRGFTRVKGIRANIPSDSPQRHFSGTHNDHLRVDMGSARLIVGTHFKVTGFRQLKKYTVQVSATANGPKSTPEAEITCHTAPDGSYYTCNEHGETNNRFAYPVYARFVWITAIESTGLKPLAFTDVLVPGLKRANVPESRRTYTSVLGIYNKSTPDSKTCWIRAGKPGDHIDNKFLTMDLGCMSTIGGTTVCGRRNDPHQYATKYKVFVSHSPDSGYWRIYGPVDKKFKCGPGMGYRKGDKTPHPTSTTDRPFPNDEFVRARYVRIEVSDYEDYPAICADVLILDEDASEYMKNSPITKEAQEPYLQRLKMLKAYESFGKGAPALLTKSVELMKTFEIATVKAHRQQLRDLADEMSKKAAALVKGVDIREGIRAGVPENRRTYSSVYNDDAPGSNHARSTLDGPQAWSAKYKQPGAWVTMDLGTTKIVCGTVIQCRATTVYADQYIKRYRVEYSLDGEEFKKIPTKFKGVKGTKENPFLPVKARYVKIVVLGFNLHPSCRCDVLVHRYDRANVPQSKRSWSSSFRSPYHQSCIDSPTAWCSKNNKVGEWLRFDLGAVKTVGGTVIQPRLDCPQQYVTEYKVAYSLEADSGYTTLPHVFKGNAIGVKGNDFPNGQIVQARFIKILPQKWNKSMSCRADVLLDNSSIGTTPQERRSWSSCHPHPYNQSWLNAPTAWCSMKNEVGMWLRLDLGAVKVVGGTAIQPRLDCPQQYVTEYKVAYSLEADTGYTELPDIFTGPAKGTKRNYFPHGATVQARYIKILPQKWNRHMSCRAEALGPAYRPLINPAIIGYPKLYYKLKDFASKLLREMPELDFTAYENFETVLKTPALAPNMEQNAKMLFTYMTDPDMGGQWYGVQQKALSSICQEYDHGTLVILKHPLMASGMLDKAQDTHDNALTLKEEIVAKTEATLKDVNDMIQDVKDRAAAQMEEVQGQINAIENQIVGDLLAQLTAMMKAEHECQQYQDDAAGHLDDMQDSIDAGVGASERAKSEEEMKNSPAGQLVKESQDALFDWENGDLADKFHSAAAAAEQAAKYAKEAAEVYKAIMEKNHLNMCSIKGSALWSKDDITFDIEGRFEFSLHINLVIFHCDIDIGPFSINIHVSLNAIKNLFKAIFTHIWDAIKGWFGL